MKNLFSLALSIHRLLLPAGSAVLLGLGSATPAQGDSFLPASSQFNSTPTSAQCSVGTASKATLLQGPFDVPLDPANIQSYGQCTYWVQEKRPDLIVNAVQKFGGGNAWDWEVDAVAAGYPIDHAPRVGDVAAYPRGAYIFTQNNGVVWSAGEVGHVAYVERVDPDGSYVLSEMNVAFGLHGDIALAPATAAKQAYFIHQLGSAPTPVVSMTAKTTAVAENGGAVKVSVTRTGTPTGALTVFYTVEGSAVAGSHYKTLSGTMTIPDGKTTGTISLQPKNDHLADGNHFVKLSLKIGRGYLVGKPATTKITILEVD